MAQVKLWEHLGDSPVLQTPVFEVLRRRCRSPKDGLEKNFSCLAAPDWVNVLPLTDDGRAVLVRQYRHGSRRLSLELPGGVVEPGQSPEETARRELMEETGWSAADFRLLCSLNPNPALFGNAIHTFVARGARPAGATCFDENEDLELELVPEERLADLITEGLIDHALMVAAIGRHLLDGRRPA
ncbi:MAG: NUDIX hydrolase [Deltaproteobacteria bacterium]|jgi:8-oxo-dGTP pyrophosphatase MutT (NUDIX family)|nr:NUDIX hydrolase [Deltaproteobacteria bacterium]